jgi:hypothetical protein
MALGSTQPLTGMSTRKLPGGIGRPARKADNLNAICEPIVQKIWKPRRLTTLWASTACCRGSFTFFYNESYNFLMTMAMNLSAFSNVTPCSLIDDFQRFGETCCKGRYPEEDWE